MSYSQAASSFRQSYCLRLGIAAAMLCFGAGPVVAQTPPTVAPPAKPAPQSASVDVPPDTSSVPRTCSVSCSGVMPT